MKKVAIVPLFLVDGTKEGRFIEANAQTGALIFGILDGDGEEASDSLRDSIAISDPELVTPTINLLQDDLQVLLSSILRRLNQPLEPGAQTGERTAPLNGLTPREKEILILIAEGNTNKEIAKELFLSVKTVETHRRNIYRKLKIHNRTGATAYAIRCGLV